MPKRVVYLNDYYQAKIVELTKLGMSKAVIEKYIDIPPKTIARWMRCSRPKYKSFRRALLEAELIPLTKSLTSIMVDISPANARWYLQKRFPGEWGEDDLTREKLRLEIENLKSKNQTVQDININVSLPDYDEVDQDETVEQDIEETKDKSNETAN